MKNECSGPITFATTMAYPSAEALPKKCMEAHASANGTAHWCTAGWWTLSPGQSLYVGQTTYRWAQAHTPREHGGSQAPVTACLRCAPAVQGLLLYSRVRGRHSLGRQQQRLGRQAPKLRRRHSGLLHLDQGAAHLFPLFFKTCAAVLVVAAARWGCRAGMLRAAGDRMWLACVRVRPRGGAPRRSPWATLSTTFWYVPRALGGAPGSWDAGPAAVGVQSTRARGAPLQPRPAST